MPPANRKSPAESEARDFRISGDTIVRSAEAERIDPIPDAVELPRFYDEPLLFAIARDPRTIFACWSVDWASVFDNTAPADRKVHLRVYCESGDEATATATEPMAGNCYITVPQQRATYRVEIGYYEPENVWNSVATSKPVAMPADGIAENVDIDVATIPFHLSFQRLVDLFRAGNTDALAEIIARLQRRAVTPAERDLLTREERKIIRAMNVSLKEMESARAAFETRPNPAALRRRAETLLGFGATSPGRPFASSSW